MTELQPSEAEWLAMFDRFSNWGRWGSDDELGLLNLVTEEKVAAAAQLVRTGRRVSCARVIDFAERAAGPETSNPPLHFMTWTGAGAPAVGGSGAMDWLGLPLHGLYVSHMDAPSHAFWNGTMFNGFPASDVSTERGASRGSIDLVSSGIVTRGVLIDVARAQGVEMLPPGHPIGESELRDACSGQGVVVEPGDLVLVRTGYGAVRRTRRPVIRDGADPASAPHMPGLGPGSLPFFAEHDVAVVGTDVGTEARPSDYSFDAPVHVVLMCAMGAWVLDNLDLEELGATCAELGRWEFLVTAAPLRLRRSTGCPVNPIAVF